MGESAIISKLRMLLTNGIHTEADALYFVAEVRKLLEHQRLNQRYNHLKFHCDWALHAKLCGPTAQKILSHFDAANIHLKAGAELHDLPGLLSTEIDRISKMEYFKCELESFLVANRLPNLITMRSDSWTHFLHLYAQIVEDCPLEMTTKNKSANITHVTLKMELASRLLDGEMFFKVRWIIRDKNGLTGEIFVLHSFSFASRESHPPEVLIPSLHDGTRR